jgi:glycolate dehydrogenase FAD-linked subunit
VEAKSNAAPTTAPPVDPVDPARLELLLGELRIALPALRLLADPGEREAYRLDETAYLSAGLPGAVAFPADTAEVSTILRLASRHRVAVVPRGAGTGLSGGAAGIEGALTIALTRLDRILEIDPANLCVITQPGVINADLKAAVAREGLFYPPDPASYETCSIGGNLGTNAGGLCCVKYGQTRDWVLGLEVVLADGSVIRTGGRTVKDTAGYSLTHLFVGSQGTLGIITEATLRLRPLPGPRATMLAFFATLAASGEAVAATTRAGIVPVTLELLDHETILAVDDSHQLGLDRDAAAMLLVESDAPGAAAAAELDAAEAAILAAGATSIVRAADATEGDWLRQARRLALRALERQGMVRMEDVGVPRSRVPELLVAIERIAKAHGVRCATFGHAGDGNLHPNLIFDRDDPAAERLTAVVRDEIFRVALDLGGTVTAEHGIGSARREWLPIQRGERAVGVMRAIKDALDPLGILNPGRVLEASLRAPERVEGGAGEHESVKSGILDGPTS